MSADYWLEGDGCDDSDAWNVTYNLGRMLRAAGYPAWEALHGAPAVEVGGLLRKVGETLRAEPDRFRQFNPPNGYGTYEDAIGFVDSFAAGCAAHPGATIGAGL